MNQERLMTVILGPHISEKTANIADKNNQHAFKVIRGAKKEEIKKAVEKLFDVKGCCGKYHQHERQRTSVLVVVKANVKIGKKQ